MIKVSNKIVHPGRCLGCSNCYESSFAIRFINTTLFEFICFSIHFVLNYMV